MELNKLLQDVLGQEEIKKVSDVFNEKGIHLTEMEKAEERYEKLKTQKEMADSQLEKANETITELQKSNQSNESLQTQIQDYQSQIEELNQKNAETQKQSFINLALLKAGAKNNQAVSSLLDMNKIELSEDGITGLDEQLEYLKENESYLFAKEESNQPNIQANEEPNGSAEADADVFSTFIENRYK